MCDDVMMSDDAVETFGLETVTRCSTDRERPAVTYVRAWQGIPVARYLGDVRTGQ